MSQETVTRRSKYGETYHQVVLPTMSQVPASQPASPAYQHLVIVVDTVGDSQPDSHAADTNPQARGEPATPTRQQLLVVDKLIREQQQLLRGDAADTTPQARGAHAQNLPAAPNVKRLKSHASSVGSPTPPCSPSPQDDYGEGGNGSCEACMSEPSIEGSDNESDFWYQFKKLMPSGANNEADEGDPIEGSDNEAESGEPPKLVDGCKDDEIIEITDTQVPFEDIC
jgi:hypothetical protein